MHALAADLIFSWHPDCLAIPARPAGDPDEGWIRAVEAIVERGRCDRGRVQVTVFRHLVNARGGRGNW